MTIVHQNLCKIVHFGPFNTENHHSIIDFFLKTSIVSEIW